MTRFTLSSTGRHDIIHLNLIKQGESKMTPPYKNLNRNKLNNRKHHIISSEESLKDVIPIEWSVSVLTGAKQIVIFSSQSLQE